VKRNMKNELIVSVLCAVGLTLAGCKPKEDLKPLQDETAQLVEQVKTNNANIDSTTKELNVCKTEHADVTKSNAVVTEPAPFEVPTLTGGETSSGLKEYKDALSAVIQKQEEKLNEVKKSSVDCTEELAAAKAKQEAAAKPTKATSKKKSTKKTTDSVAVDNAQEAGTATKGVKSRYKARKPN